MTEYEVASLALEQASGIREQTMIMQTQLTLVQENLTTFITLMSGYLIVAYLIGEKLTLVQVCILNLFYLVIMTFSLLGIFISQGVGIFRYEKLLLIYPDTISLPFWGVESQITLAAVLAIIVAVSIWFMWEVRHPKTA